MLQQIAQRIGIPLALLTMAGLYFLEVRRGKPLDLMLVKPVFYLMIALFCINAATDFRSIRKQGGTNGDNEETDSLKRILAFCAASIGLIVIIPYAGFVLSAMLFLFVSLWMFKVDNATVLYLLPVAVSIALYLLFEQLFSVPLPKGFLGF